MENIDKHTLFQTTNTTRSGPSKQIYIYIDATKQQTLTHRTVSVSVSS